MAGENEQQGADNLGSDIAAAIASLEGGGDDQRSQTEGTAGADTSQGEQDRGADQTEQQAQKSAGEKQVPQSGQPGQKPAVDKEGKPLPQLKKFKAPGGWKPEIREKFGTLDPLVQEEIARRESDMDRGMRAAADARKFKQEFDEAVKPYMHFFAAENATPIQAMVNMFNTAANLRTAPPQQKAQLVANLIRQFNVDIQMLDGMLAGQPIQGVQPPIQGAAMDGIMQAIEQRFGPMLQFVNQLRGREQQGAQQINQALDQSIEEFATDANNEFFEDVREEMADILEMAANRKQQISLQDAYNRAIMLHPTISQIVAQRKLQGVAAQHDAAAERAQNAAVSVRGDTPSRSEEPKSDGSLRGDLELAFSTVSKRANGR